MAQLHEHSKRAMRILQGKSIKEAYQEFPHQAKSKALKAKSEGKPYKFAQSYSVNHIRKPHEALGKLRYEKRLHASEPK